MTFCYLDTETTGLSLENHDVWEIAYAFDDELITYGTVAHNLTMADPEALKIGDYYERGGPLATVEGGFYFEQKLLKRLHAEKPTLVGANPSFDAYRLSKRWGGEQPWKHRMLDVCVYAMGPLNWDEPRGLYDTAAALRSLGFDVPEPSHTAAGDVEATRQVHRAIQGLIASQRAILSAGGSS